MTPRKTWCTASLGIFFLAVQAAAAQSISVEGAPAEMGYNVGSVALIRATLKGVTGDPSRYALFANIQYVGTTGEASVQMDQKSEAAPGESSYEAEWPVPPDAPTGLYTVIVKVEDRKAHSVVATQSLPGFTAYKKLVRITRVTLGKTLYAPGESIGCEVALENLTGVDLKNLRVEFSNANYPWISAFSGEAKLSGQKVENPEPGLKALRDHLNIAARTETTIPMMPAGTAAYLNGTQVAVLGTGGPARSFKLPPPEVDTYTIAVWNEERTILYDMQFSPQVVVRDPSRALPKPYYSHNYTHAYNDEIDFKKYRDFYAPGEVSSALAVDHARTLFRPSDQAAVKVTIKNTTAAPWSGVELHAEIADGHGNQLHAGTLGTGINLAPGESRSLDGDLTSVPSSLPSGVYKLSTTLVSADAKALAATTTDLAVNSLPASLLVFSPHEDDEHPYAGLIRAAVEVGIPVRVVFFTGGDVGECERYFNKPCGPNEAHEFGTVRMEESMEALEHIGLTRDHVLFLGLPDGGSGAIWRENIRVSNPFLDIYLATDHAPYENLVKPNLPYARDAVIEVVKQIIMDFHPAMIATSHPDERHVDHRTANWFVIKACQELLRDKRIDPQTVVLADQSYGAGGFTPAPYKYEEYKVFLSGEAAALKQEMSWIYQSQDGNLAEGGRQTFAELPREEIHYRILDWQEHAGWNE